MKFSSFLRLGSTILTAEKILFRTLWTVYQLVLGLVFIAIVAGFFRLADYANWYEIRRLRGLNPGETSFMHMERRRILTENTLAKSPASKDRDIIRRTWVPWEAIPHRVKDMVIIAEDGKFYQHYGFDLEQIEYAVVANRQQGRRFRGASTISQQVVKNLYLTSEKSYGRKIQEALMTALLEASLSKNRILEIYLNIAQFGPGVFGVEEGARYHFDKGVDSLDFGETVSLIAVLPKPRMWRPGSSSPFYHRHRVRILKNLNLYESVRRNVNDDDYLTFEKFAEEEARIRWSQLQNRESGSAALPGDSASKPDSATRP